MAQQVLDPPAAQGVDRPTEPVPQLGPDWRCFADGIIRAYGEEGRVDLVALHPVHGVALIGFLDEGEEASPEEAHQALRTMLRDEGFEKRFSGELSVIALALPRSERPQLSATMEHAFAKLSRSTVPPDWVDWLAERVAPAGPRLVILPREEVPETVPETVPVAAKSEAAAAAPPEDEAPPEKIAPEIALVVPPDDPASDELTPESALTAAAEAPVSSETEERHSWLDWGMSLGFAVGIFGALLASLAVLSRRGGLF